jgi:drug/metabolite transporter (DMT)-like permease
MSMLKFLPFVNDGVLIAIIAHGLIGISLVWDKVLLKRPQTTDLASYVFWLGIISIFGMVLIFFGFEWPALWVTVLALVTGFLHLLAVYFYYAALKAGEASQTLAIVGGFSPVATALIGIPLLQKQLGGDALIAFALLTAGGFLMFFSERVNTRHMLPWIVLSSSLFGLVNVLQKVVFNNTNFVSGYVFFTLGTALAAGAMLVYPRWRREILTTSQESEPGSRFWYFVNRLIDGLGSFLIFYAISLASPALVDAITAVRYVIIFLGAYLLTRLRPVWLSENFTGTVLLGKSIATAMVVAGLVWLGLQGGAEGGGPAAKNRADLPVFFTACRYKHRMGLLTRWMLIQRDQQDSYTD